MRFFIFFSALYFSYGTAIGWEIDWEFDTDLNCCLQKVHLQNHFIIKLDTEDQPIGDMVLTTPENIKIGVNLDDFEYFFPPKKSGIYALGPRPKMNIAGERWDFSRYIILFKRKKFSKGYFLYEKLTRDEEINPEYKLPKGKYKLQIKASHSGNYRIIIYPNGVDDSTTALYWPLQNTKSINAGELHMIHLNISEQGKFELSDS